MSTPPQQPSEEELRAAYEAEIKKVRVQDLVIQSMISLINLGGRKGGLAPGTEDEADPAQLKLAIDAANALLPLVEDELGGDAGQVRNAVSQLQMAYAQGAGQASAGASSPPPPPQPSEPPKSSGRLWVPGQ